MKWTRFCTMLGLSLLAHTTNHILEFMTCFTQFIYAQLTASNKQKQPLHGLEKIASTSFTNICKTRKANE